MAEEREPYEVGYRKPPAQSRFSKGKSGNPNGRPKGSRNISSMLASIASKPVQITEGSRTRTVPLIEAVLIQLARSAAKGDRHSRRELVALLQSDEARMEAELSDHEPDERDLAVLDGAVSRLLRQAEARGISLPPNFEGKP